MTHKASCSCGQLNLETKEQPLRVSVCHCYACQKRTGSAFGVQARFEKNMLTISGNSKRYERIADTGNKAIFHFCPDCGSTLYYILEAIPDMVGVPIGGFSDPSFMPPSISIYEDRQHSWLSIAGDIEHIA